MGDTSTLTNVPGTVSVAISNPQPVCSAGRYKSSCEWYNQMVVRSSKRTDIEGGEVMVAWLGLSLVPKCDEGNATCARG